MRHLTVLLTTLLLALGILAGPVSANGGGVSTANGFMRMRLGPLSWLLAMGRAMEGVGSRRED